MSELKYISTNEIRQNLVGFLKEVSMGKEFVVLNRSKPIVKVSGTIPGAPNETPGQNIQKFLEIAAKTRKSAKGTLDPKKSYKQLYGEAMAKKYGITGR